MSFVERFVRSFAFERAKFLYLQKWGLVVDLSWHYSIYPIDGLWKEGSGIGSRKVRGRWGLRVYSVSMPKNEENPGFWELETPRRHPHAGSHGKVFALFLLTQL